MEKQEFYYKCVRETVGNLYSIMILKGNYCVKYEVGKRVKAPLNGLFVFDTYWNATNFIDKEIYTHRFNFFVYKAKVFGEEVDLFEKCYIGGLEENNVIGSGNYEWPKGTHCFPEIELIEKV